LKSKLFPVTQSEQFVKLVTVYYKKEKGMVIGKEGIPIILGG